MFKLIALLITIVSCIVFAAVEDEILLRGTNDGPTPTPNVHGTNDVTLFIRALYQDCDDYNDDYLAASFLQEPKKTIASNKFTRDAARNGLATVSQNNVVYFSARTVYLDNLLQDAIENGIKQVVIIAAGYDSRAYRFGKANPEVQFFELDLPQVIKAKTEDVAALGLSSVKAEHIGVDLASIPVKVVLEKNEKFIQGEPTLYLVEGLVYYLPQTVVDSLFSSLGEVAAPGSILAYDFANKCLFEHSCEDLPDWEITTFLKVLELKQEPWKSGMEPSEHKEWLADKGFDLGELISFHNAKEVLGVTTWTKSPVMSQLNFVTAVVSKPLEDLQSYLYTSYLASSSNNKRSKTIEIIKTVGIANLFRFALGKDDDLYAASIDENMFAQIEGSGRVAVSDREKANYARHLFATRLIQTVYYDEVVEVAIMSGIKQVVIVGAEIDTKAYRFGETNPDVTFFEIDVPEVMNKKIETVSNLGFDSKQIEHISADVTKIPVKEALLNNEKFVQDEPTLYLLNGLAYHLPQTAVDSLFKSLGEVAAPNSMLAYDFANECLLNQSCKKSSTKKLNSFLKAMKSSKAPWINGMDPSYHRDWLSTNYGFEISEMYTLFDAGIKLGVKSMRQTTALTSEMNFVVAIKRHELKDFVRLSDVLEKELEETNNVKNYFPL